MFKSLIPINNILLAENGYTIARDKNLLTGKNNYVCFYNNNNSPIGLNLYLDDPDAIPSGSSVHLKDSSGTVLFSGSKISGNEMRLTCKFEIQNVYAHPFDNFVLELISPNGGIISNVIVQFNMYYIPVEQESNVLYRKGLPVEVLDQVYITSTNSTTRAIANSGEGKLYAPLVTATQIVNNNFKNTPPKYDVANGTAYFGNYDNKNAITFHYKAYLAANKKAGTVLNCYDCAALTQYLFIMNNYQAQYCFMQPFGYLFTTNLIGWGQCNNPFFKYKGVTVNQIVLATLATRTSFANHAFVRLTANNAIADSCAGPHIANETINGYIKAAVDAVYPNPPAIKAGTSANVGYYTGVTKTDFIEPVTSTIYNDQLKDPVFNTANLSPVAVSSSKSLMNIATIEAMINQAGWKTFYRETVGGQQECLQILFFEKNNEVFYLKIFVSNDTNEHAINRFLDLALNNQSPEHGWLKVAGSPYHQHVESKTEDQQVNLIHHYNLAIQLYTSDVGMNLTDLTKSFVTPINVSLVPMNKKKKEVKVEVLFDPSTQQYRLNLIDPGVNDVLEFIDVDDNLKLIDCSRHSLVFEKINKKKTNIRVWSINRLNLSITQSKLLPVK